MPILFETRPKLLGTLHAPQLNSFSVRLWTLIGQLNTAVDPHQTIQTCNVCKVSAEVGSNLSYKIILLYLAVPRIQCQLVLKGAVIHTVHVRPIFPATLLRPSSATQPCILRISENMEKKKRNCNSARNCIHEVRILCQYGMISNHVYIQGLCKGVSPSPGQ